MPVSLAVIRVTASKQKPEQSLLDPGIGSRVYAELERKILCDLVNSRSSRVLVLTL